MRALITGAGSGIGRDMAILLDGMGYELILCSKNHERLLSLQSELRGEAEIIALDLSQEENCFALYRAAKDKDIDFLINNAGFGLFGEFSETSLDRELEMINLNVKCVHILTKLFLCDFKRKNQGRILNVASAAAFSPGPLLATYYGSKAYVLRLTQSIAGELRKSGSAVTISALCPGPVKTNFDRTAGVTFSAKGLDSSYVAEYAIKQALRGRVKIIPGAGMKIAAFMTRFAPDRLLTDYIYHFQKKKGK